MTISMFTRSKVKDFGVWKELFDSSTDFTKQHGVIASNVLCDLDDPNLVIVHHQFDDAGKARAFVDLINSDQFRKGPPVTEGGVILETLEIWVGEDA